MVNNQLLKSNIDCASSGSTLTALLVKENLVVCANTGDSRAFLFTQPKTVQGEESGEDNFKMEELTVEHKPSLQLEKERIERCGGVVHPAFKAGVAYGVDRVFARG